MNNTTLSEYKRLRQALDYPAKHALQYARDWSEILRIEREYDCEVIAEFENDIEVRGNFATGDDDLDRKYEEEIIARLAFGDVWAWAQVEVKVSKDGFEHSEYIGGCSYASEDDWRHGGYYADMLRACVSEVERQIADSKLSEAVHAGFEPCPVI